MNGKKTYFISDLHLGASYITDRRQHEQRVVEWLQSIQSDCERLFLVGDILDYWYEYKYVVPRGYVRFFGQLASMSDAGVEITWLIGNHDIWIFDYIPSELGVKVVDGAIIQEIEGKKFYISHGDGVGYQSRGFRFLRSLFRNRFCQRLYSAVHPGLTIPFAHNWSASSRKGEQKYKADKPKEYATDNVERWAKGYAIENRDINYIVMGHYHQVVDKKITKTCRLVVLGDWIDKFSFAVFDGNDLKMMKYN